MSYPPPDHRSIASEWQTTSLRAPKESRESDGAGLRKPGGDTLTNAVSTSTSLCTRGTHIVQEHSYLFSLNLFFSSPYGTNCWIKSGKRRENSDLAPPWSAPACSACWRVSTATCAPNARIETGAPL